MPIFDFECEKCSHIEEAITDSSVRITICPKCGCNAKKIFSGSHRTNDDAKWIRSVLEVVDRESRDPAVREFVKRPTRTNYKNWMKATSLRHFEPGEERQRPQEPDMSKVNKEMWGKLQDRRRLSVG